MVVTPPCDSPITPTDDGHHHPGEDCLTCHHQGNSEDAPPFTYAGTLFDSSGGAAPLAGGALHLIDANGLDAFVQTAINGNFYSTDLLTFPVVAFVSTCPTVVEMQNTIGDADGSCNQSGCHTSGFRLH
jgi:hypothetical protein